MIISKNSPLVVFGAGSIGERHIEVLLSLGFTDIHVYRQRNLPLRNVDPAAIKIFTDIDHIDVIKPVAAFITSPTAFHTDQAMLCLKKGIHVLVEKPLSHKTDDLQKLSATALEHNALVMVGYMLRYHPAFKRLKATIADKTYGNLLYFHTHWGEFLPDWHPWEDYRTSYAAKKELGGGAALTLSHDLDIVNWLMDAQPTTHTAVKQYSSVLEVDVEAGADLVLLFPNGVNGHVHLNFFQKIPFREYHFVFEEAFIRFNYFENKMVIRTVNGTEEATFDQFERNDMFKEQAMNFFDTININNEYGKLSLNNIKSSQSIIDMCNNILIKN